MKYFICSTLPVLLILISVALLGSCDIRQDINLNPDLSGTLSISGESKDFAALAFENLSFMGGFDNASALYNDAVINTELEMAKREDLSSFELKMTSAHGWESTADFSDLRLLLGSPDAVGIADFEKNGNISTLTLRFDKETSQQYGKLIPLFKNPAFAIFDPSANSHLDEESYIQNILGFSFGPENIPEIRMATVTMNLTLPGTVVRVIGGRKTSTSSVNFEMPLTRMLVPDPPVVWSVSWQ